MTADLGSVRPSGRQYLAGSNVGGGYGNLSGSGRVTSSSTLSSLFHSKISRECREGKAVVLVHQKSMFDLLSKVKYKLDVFLRL